MIAKQLCEHCACVLKINSHYDFKKDWIQEEKLVEFFLEKKSKSSTFRHTDRHRKTNRQLANLGAKSTVERRSTVSGWSSATSSSSSSFWLSGSGFEKISTPPHTHTRNNMCKPVTYTKTARQRKVNTYAGAFYFAWALLFLSLPHKYKQQM